MNRYRFYILTIDSPEILSRFNSKKFHEKLISTRGIFSWWHYLESTYILKVGLNVTADHVAELIQLLAPDKQFFTTEILLNNYSGWLEESAWEWIEENKK